MPYKDPEKQREADRRWRAANLEKAREANRRWRKANPEKQREAIRRCARPTQRTSARRTAGGVREGAALRGRKQSLVKNPESRVF
jgi:hypothetical protein